MESFKGFLGFLPNLINYFSHKYDNILLMDDFNLHSNVMGHDASILF